MKRKKVIIIAVTISTVFLLAFTQLNQKEKVHADFVNYESLAAYVKSYDSSDTLKKFNSVIDEKKYAEQYFFKTNLVSEKMTDTEAKRQAYNQVIEETALFQKSKELGLLATRAEAKILSDEARIFLKDEPEKNKEIIQIKNDILKGLEITEDEYFNEFLVDRYVVDLSIENLYEYVTKVAEDEVKEKLWTEFKTSEANNFVSENKENLNQFMEFNDVK